MVFPVTPLDTTVELQIDSVWADITSYVYTENGINVGRGRSDEASSAEPGWCKFTVNNRDGRFSPRNPSGAYFGKIGRNTPVRVSTNLGTTRLVSTGGTTARATTPDSAGLSITGDIDIRLDMRLPAWNIFATLVGKIADPSQRSWALVLNADGRLTLFWSADGTNYLSAQSVVPVPQSTGRQAVRATLDVNNGAAGRTITFYTAPTISGTWTQLGDAVVQAGVTSIFDSTTAVAVGTSSLPGAEIYALKILQGIAGTERANPDFTAQTHGATSFADAAGNTWTCAGDATASNKRTRFVGEVSSWPVGWDISERDVFVNIEAAGIRRRLGQGSSPFRSAFYRAASNLGTSLKGYWPMEDSDGATQFASALPGRPAMSVTSQIEFAADPDSFLGTEALPTMNGGTAAGYVTPFATGFCQARFLARVPNPPPANALLASIRFTGGTVGRVDLAINTAGSLNIAAYDHDGVFIDGTGFVAMTGGTLDRSLRYSMELTQTGADLNMGVVILGPGEVSGTFTSILVLGRTMGTTTSVILGPSPTGVLGVLGAVTMGHLTVQDEVTDIFDLADVLDGYSGEAAGTRATRLAAEESVPLKVLGFASESELMGAQTASTFLDLFDEAATVDLAIATEDAGTARLAFRTRTSLYNQHPLTLDYDYLNNLVPVDDDQAVQNDVTVSRVNGSSSRQELTTGSLSTQAPPNGIGRYDSALDLSLATDAQADDQASWRLMTGTVDETRYPTLSFDLNKTSVFTSALTASVLDMVEGDLLHVTSPPTFAGSPDTIKQIVVGWEETLSPYSYEFRIVCVPASPYNVGVYDYGVTASRYAGDGSTLNAGITSTATGAGALSLVTPAGKPLWTTAAGDFPMNIRVGGEVITLSAIAATASPQSATVSARSVNGVVKSHLAGAAVDIADPAFYAL